MWVITFLILCGGVYYSTTTTATTDGQQYQASSVPSYPLRLDVTEATYLAEDNNGNRKTFKLVDPNPASIVRSSSSYVAPKHFKDSSTNTGNRDKRENSSGEDDFDYTKSYREFVRDNFGIDDAKAFVDDSYNDDDDGGREDREYERIKELSQKQTEDKENSKYCKLIHKDGKDCTICKNPKTKAESETCSYSSKPKPKKYAYKRERNYNSKDDDDDDYDGDDHEEEASQKNERRTPKTNKHNNSKKNSKKSNGQHTENQHETRVKPKSSKKNKARKPVPRQASEYYNDQALKSTEPYSSTIGSGKVDKVLDEFKKRDWSKCKKKSQDGLTCYYCRDPKGGNHEECMYISDDTPSASTLVNDYELPPNENLEETQKRSQSKQRRQSPNLKRSDKIAPNPDLEANPENHQTFKRMVSVKIHEDGNHDPSANKEVFYKKIVQVDRK